MLIYLYYVKTYEFIFPLICLRYRYLKMCLKIILIKKKKLRKKHTILKKNRDVILNQTSFENAFFFHYSTMKNLRGAIG